MNDNLRKLRYRAWHRGFREMDILLGKFADKYLDKMTSSELSDFERILNQPDQDLYEWITGRRSVPTEYESSMFTKLQDFCKKVP